jgi:hypothetical protein
VVWPSPIGRPKGEIENVRGTKKGKMGGRKWKDRCKSIFFFIFFSEDALWGKKDFL